MLLRKTQDRSCLRRSHRKCNHDVFVSKNAGDQANGAVEDERDRKWKGTTKLRPGCDITLLAFKGVESMPVCIRDEYPAWLSALGKWRSLVS